MATSDAPAATLFGTDRRVLALAFARMADALGNSFLVIVLPLYVASGVVQGEVLGLSTSLIAGIVLALFGLASSAAQPFAGRLSDRMGKRKVFVWGGLLVFGVSNFAFLWVESYWALFVLRIVQGVAAAFTITATLALVNEMSRVDTRGGNMGIYNSFRLIGFGAGPLIASVMIESGPFTLPGGATLSGFDAAFYVAAGAAFVSVALVGVLVSDPVETEPSDRSFGIAVFDASGRHVLDPIFALGIATLIMAACFAMLSTIEPEVNARLDQGPILFSLEFVALIVTLALLQPLVGRSSDRVGRKRFIVLGLIGLVPTTLVQGFVVEPWQMIAARAVQGVAGAMVFAPALALGGDYARRGQSGAQLSVLTVSFGLGISLGQLLSGYFVQYGFAIPFVVGAALATGASALVVSQVEDRFDADANAEMDPDVDPEIDTDDPAPATQTA